MSRLLPQKSPIEVSDTEPQIVGFDDANSADVFSVLSADTARTILSELYEDPATQSEIADRVETSIQNVSYHLDNLVNAGLVTVVDQWYSEKGTTMDVYAPAGGSLVLVAGDCEPIDDACRAATSQPSVEVAPQPGD